MRIRTLPPNGFRTLTQHSPVEDHHPEEALVAALPEGSTKSFMRLYSSAVGGNPSARTKLEARLANEPQAVGMVYDAWKKGSDMAALDLLKGTNIERHASCARFDPEAVFALSLVRAATKRDDVKQEMIDLDALEIFKLAQTDPRGVFALTHLKDAGHPIAGDLLLRVDVTGHAQEAERNPFAVYALSHLAKAGKEAGKDEALDAMRNLPVENLAAKMESDEHARRAINILVEAGNENALIAMISRVPGVNEKEIRTKIEAARSDALALIDVVRTMKELGPEARDLIGVLDVSRLHIDMSTIPKEDRWALVDVIEELILTGNEGAFALLCRAARYNCWAVWVLDRLRFRPGIDAAEAMANLDVSLYAKPALSSPGVVITLQLLAHMNNAGAIEIMQKLNASELISRASSLRNPKAANEAATALEALARYRNDAAAEWLRARKKTRR